MITIIAYDKKYQPNFKRLVIERGGCIFLAMDGKKVIGTAGLWKENEKEYELIKMAVDPPYRGQGISKLLLNHCLEKAKKLKANKIFLYSNSQLQTALKLYEKYGFRHIPAVDTPFVTADVKMELSLSSNQL